MTKQGESPYLYGIHASSGGAGWDTTGADLLDGQGWVVFTEAIGEDSNGRSYLPWADKGLGVIVRLNYGYGEAGTIPLPGQYGEFAAQCRYYVASSQGCHIWIIGNEPNHSKERPEGQEISPANYAACYAWCRSQILLVQPDAQVLLAGPSCWNWDSGDFGIFWDNVIQGAAQQSGFDGVAIHAYTHGADPAFIFSDEPWSPPGEQYHRHFRIYRDLLEPIPEGVPIYITETDQDDPWVDTNSGWVRNAYREIDDWNAANPEKVIRCLALYRWTHDRWEFKTKAGVQADLMQAIDEGYKWTDEPPEEGDVVEIPIINPGFEDGWREVDGIHELKVANGWEPWWHATDTRPEYKIATLDVDSTRIKEGEVAQQWFNTYAHHTAGIYQIVNDISQGVTLHFDAWVQAFTRNDDNDWRKSTGRYRMRIGIDPYGGTDPEGKDIVWCDAIQPYDAYSHLEISAEARSDRCSLWVWGQAEWRYKHNNAYVDSCRLLYEGETPPEPPEPPPVGDYVTRTEMKEYYAEKTPLTVYTVLAAVFQEMADTLRGEVTGKSWFLKDGEG